MAESKNTERFIDAEKYSIWFQVSSNAIKVSKDEQRSEKQKESKPS